MSPRTFVAFSSADPILSDTIVEACKQAQRRDSTLEPWNRNDPSGNSIDQSVYTWVESANSFVADVSEPNDNVTYEIGLAIGMRKPVRLIRAANKDLKKLTSIGLLHNIAHDQYDGRQALARILEKSEPKSLWPQSKKNREHPIYFLQLSFADNFTRKVSSHIKKTLKLKFRNLNPTEIDRLTATEAFEQVSQSFGVIAIWDTSNSVQSIRQNQRTSFVTGLARGLDVPFVLFAHSDDRLPLDLDEIATRWSSAADLSPLMRAFREEVYDVQESHVETRLGKERFLDRVYCGDPAAENEAAQLDGYFLETEQFRLTTNGDLNILLGRKGSGKTAIFLQARNRTRADRSNIVVDLQPEGYQLIRLKEFILERLSGGARKEFIASFWEYIVWLEIAYKLLEKDEKRVRYDSRLIPAYDRLRGAYTTRVEGSGDFTERLEALIERIVGRYQQGHSESAINPSSSELLEIVYGREIGTMRNEVLSYLKVKGIVFFLFDNLDRFWTAPSFSEMDALIVTGLVESLTDIRRRFRQSNIEFYWAVFLRSDVFEFVIKTMADYGKLSVDSVEWNDPELLIRLFKRRMLEGFGQNDQAWDEVWKAVSIQEVEGRPTLEFLIDSSLMRPRYLIRLFETARRRAITLGKSKIEEDDYRVAVDELGWQVLEDFDRELADVVPDVEELMFELVQLGERMSLATLRGTIEERVSMPETVDVIVDVLIWMGCIGVQREENVTFISDCGFKRPYMRALLKDPSAEVIVLHPTLATIIARPRL